MSRTGNLMAIFAFLAFANPSLAATIHVPADQPTIQDGIDAAANGDEVVVADGTYNEIIDFNGKAVTVRSANGAAVTTIDATSAADPGDGKPVVRCDNGEGSDTVLEGFTLTGGTGDSVFVGGGITGGGGMFTIGTSPTVMDCVFSGNSADVGGGMYNNGSHPTMTNCTFDGNSAAPFHGGGVYNSNSSPTMTNCAFNGNTANSNGGGLFNNSGSSPTLTNCALNGNSVNGNGGGLYNGSGSSPTLTNCVLSGNSAGASGGGMYNSDSHPTVGNGTFSGNTAEVDGGGMWNGGNSGGSSPTVTNSIFWGNVDDADASAGGPFTDESAQIHVVLGTPVVNTSDVQGGWTGAGGTGNLNADPLFVDADGADNTVGTADDDLRLQGGSPCIDAGDNSVVTASTDLDGSARIVNCVTDMGAYEDQTVTGTPVENVTQSTFYATLEAAIDAAIANDVIEASPCVYNEIIDFSGKAITVRSTDPTDPVVVAKTIIDATSVTDPGTGKPVVRWNGEPDTVLDGFTITGGTGDSVFVGGGETAGGGMFITNVRRGTVKNCVFVGNTADHGGGMYMEDAVYTTVTNCTFTGNTAEYGAGMDIESEFSHPTIKQCTFSGNTATGVGLGGGLRTANESRATVIQCTFIGNAARLGGGISASLHAVLGRLTVAGCNFIGNTATLAGGGIYSFKCAVTLMSCAFSGNSSGNFSGGAFIHHDSPGVWITATNCTFSGNTAVNLWGGITINGPSTMTNCILWGNSDSGGMDLSAQIEATEAVVNYSNVQGGWTGAGGTGNLNADPLFVDADGADNVFGTDDDDLRLSAGSACIDAGDMDAYVLHVGPVIDVGGLVRTVDDGATVDTGVGTLTYLDLGAHELAGSLYPAGVVRADFDEDGDVDGVDFSTFASCFNKAGNPPREENCPE